MRWEHPERGLLYPDEFTPLAEETGLLVPLGYWVLKEACRQTKAWNELHPDKRTLPVSVNFSARQFRQPDLAEEVVSILAEVGLDPGCLELEVTETSVMEHAEDTTFRRLKDLGVRISIDDFGTGYSSLSKLRSLPVDTVKVDRTFITGIVENREDEMVVSGIIHMASGLNLAVVAEGMETSGQAKLLRDLGCDLAQGHYFTTPLTGEKVLEFLAGNRLAEH